MKALKILFVISLIISQSSFSQKPKKAAELKLTKSAQQLFKSYNAILQNQHDFICDFPPKTSKDHSVEIKRKYKWGLMEAKDYASGAKGKLSFLSFVWTSYKNDMLKNEDLISNGIKTFRTAWFYDSEDLTSFLDYCYKIFKTKKVRYVSQKNTQNHVFQLILVPVSIYNKNNSTATTFGQDENTNIAYGELLNYALDINKIDKIGKLLITKRTHIPATNLGKYDDKSSSVGVVSNVTLKDKTQEPCYVFNNYDGLEIGTVRWKK